MPSCIAWATRWRSTSADSSAIRDDCRASARASSRSRSSRRENSTRNTPLPNIAMKICDVPVRSSPKYTLTALDHRVTAIITANADPSPRARATIGMSGANETNASLLLTAMHVSSDAIAIARDVRWIHVVGEPVTSQSDAE